MFKKYDTFKTDAAREWRDLQFKEGRVIMDQEDVDTVNAMAQQIEKHPTAGPLIAGCESEVTWRATHPSVPIPLQCRTDLWKRRTAIDLKVTASLDTDEFINFEKSVWRLGYHRQGAFYRAVLALCSDPIDDFYFVVAEHKPPYGVMVYHCGQEAMERGDVENGEDLAKLIECYRTNVWPNMPTEVREIEVPERYSRRNAA